MLSSEVLPAPFGPMIEAISPRRAENDTSSTARTPPNRLDTAVATSSSSSGDFNRRSSRKSGGACAAVMAGMMLAQSLRSLIERRDAGEIRRFRRIAIETSGLADPAPILFTLGTDPMLDQRLRLSRVVTLVDAIEGAGTLDRFAEATRQAAVADA